MINGGYGRKMVVKELFGKVKIYRLHTRVDNRGSLDYVIKIGLKLPVPISEISDYDLNAPFVSESGNR